MFAPTRFVVVDDNETHLGAIVEVIRSLGSECTPVLFKAENDLDPRSFRGVRCLFMDLQLVENTVATEYARHFANIQTILEDCISASGGPFLLMLWTQQPDRAKELGSYLVENIPDTSRHCLPVAVIPLDKREFIDVASGALNAGELLRESVVEGLSGNPGLAAFMEWELGVLECSGQVLGDLFGFIEVAVWGNTLNSGLASLFKGLCDAAVGRNNAARDPQGALSLALLPLLSDRLYGRSLGEPSNSFADAYALGGKSATKLAVQEIAKLNTRLHFAAPDLPDFVPSDWGVLSGLQPRFPWRRHGLDGKQYFFRDGLGLKSGYYGFKDDHDFAPFKVYQLRVGAACDFAQRTDGPIPFVLAGVVPDPTGKVPDKAPRNASNWVSPLISLGGDLCRLMVNPRLQYSLSTASAANLRPDLRMRESMLIELVSAIGHHGSRPGIMRF